MAEARAQTGTPGGSRAARVLRHALGPLWVTTFRDPVREGRLRLEGLSRLERQAARLGLVALAVLLGSALLAATWRRGDLVPVDLGASRDFVPAGVVGLTMVGFTLAWLALTWGGLRGSAPVRLATAVGFLLVNANFSLGASLALGEHRWILDHGRVAQEVGYWAPPVALALSALTTRWARVDQWTVRVARTVCAAGTCCLFLGLLWAHAVLVDLDRQTFLPSTITGSMLDIGLLLLPLVYLSSIAVVDFALDVSTSLARPAAGLRHRWALVALLVLVAAKLWFQVVARSDFWRATLTHQPQAVARTTLSVLGLGVLAIVVTRFRRSEDSLAAKEDLALGSSVVLSVPFAVNGLLLGLGVAVAAHTQDQGALQLVRHFPASWLNTWGMLIVSLLALVGGAVLMRRSQGGMGDELGSGLVLVGAWGTVQNALPDLGFTLGFSFATVDVVVTLVVLGAVLVRWRRADQLFLLTAATVLVFSWLVTSRGDYLSFVGGLVGLPTVVVLVFGIVWTLLSGSSFASGSSRWLPQPARPLLFTGFVLFSVAILNWNQTTHTAASDTDALTAYYFLGLPIAAWLLGRRLVARPETSAGSEPSALPEEVGDGVGVTER